MKSPAHDMIPRNIYYDEIEDEIECDSVIFIRDNPGASVIDQLSWDQIELIIKRINSNNPYMQKQTIINIINDKKNDIKIKAKKTIMEIINDRTNKIKNLRKINQKYSPQKT